MRRNSGKSPTLTAMILAAGRGERMRPLTDHTPKPLLPVGGKPLIIWHIERLAHAGITNIVINHAHLGEQIETALGTGSQLGVTIHYSAEGNALETAGGIAYALPLLGEHPFAVINGDIWCDYDFAQLPQRASTLAASADLAHLILVKNPPQHPHGDFFLSEQRLKSSGFATDKFTFSGIGLYKPSLFAGIARGSKAPLAPLLHEIISQGKVSGEYYAGNWIDVGTPQRLAELDNALIASQNSRHD
jgi:MurNAc alpha-1-phosphate uridylyltransferase